MVCVNNNMGKKNKKSRQYDDDLLGGPLLTSAAAPLDNDDKQELDMDTTHLDDDKQSSSKAKEQQRTANIDLVILEDQMLELLRNYPNRPDDWLYRTLEKNMRLPKHSLKKSLESHILEQMRWRVEEMIDNEGADAESPEEDEDRDNENIDHTSISALDEAKLRAEARMSGADPDEVVDSMKEDDDANDVDIHTKEQPHLGEAELQSLQNNKSFGVSVLLLLRPYTETYPSDKAILVTRIFLLLRQYLCIILCQVFATVFGRIAKQHATLLWENVHLPKIEAELLVKERGEDLQMLKNNAHLWSDEQGCWIEKDAVFSAENMQTLPVTIQYNQTRKQWERWSKNLTTRTKKQTHSSLTKGTFLAVREGDGWATNPTSPQIENKLLKTQYIRIFTCLPNNDGTALDVVDVTSWAAKSLLPIEAAKALQAVDSGRNLFTFGTKKKDAGKGKQKKKNKRAETNQTSTEDEWIALKGTGATAQLSKYYLDKMQ